MLKKFALIMLLLGSSIASTAWAQTDCTDDESAADECAGAVDEVSEVDAAADTDEGDLASADEEVEEDANEPDATPPPLNPQDPVVARAPNSLNHPCETLQQKFDCARAAEHLSERPDHMTMLKIYALYQQGSVGDVEGERPGPPDWLGRAKFDSWAELKGTSKDAAMGDYVDLINELRGE